MHILIYGINYYPELTGIGKYTAEMAEWLAQQGHQITVITAPPYYPEWRIKKEYQTILYKKELIKQVTIFRCPLYVPKKPTTLTRLLHLCSFAFTSFPLILKQFFSKPDIIFTIEPTFFCTPATLLLAKLSDSRSVLHIQDYELDAMLGLNMGKKGLITSFCEGIERWIMSQFDAVSSISHSMLYRAEIKLRKSSQLIYFPNWVDVDFITPFADANYFRQLWKIPLSTKVVLYSGNLGKKQGLELLIEVANEFKSDLDILFLIVGSGAVESELKQQATALGLTNLHFYPLQAYETLPQLMTLADIHLVMQKKGVADAVLPSKLTTIFAAGGTALITAEENTELASVCAQFPGIAERIAPENKDLLIEKLLTMLNKIDITQRHFNPIARQYALDYLSKQAVLTKFEQDLYQLHGKV